MAAWSAFRATDQSGASDGSDAPEPNPFGRCAGRTVDIGDFGLGSGTPNLQAPAMGALTEDRVCVVLCATPREGSAATAGGQCVALRTAVQDANVPVAQTKYWPLGCLSRRQLERKYRELRKEITLPRRSTASRASIADRLKQQ